jgi:hypothetical protein
MAIDFSKFDKTVDLEGLKKDVAAANENDSNFKEVPHDDYEIEIVKLELTESKKHDPMVSCWMRILEGEYKGSMLFMNQVVTQGFQIHIVNTFLRSLVDGMNIDIEFVSYAQYADLLLDISEAIEDKREYLITYGERKGFNTFEIQSVYNLED